MGAVYRSPTENDQATRVIHSETQVERRDVHPQEPQDSLYRDIIPR